MTRFIKKITQTFLHGKIVSKMVVYEILTTPMKKNQANYFFECIVTCFFAYCVLGRRDSMRYEVRQYTMPENGTPKNMIAFVTNQLDKAVRYKEVLANPHTYIVDNEKGEVL
jgi:hypothetical protein